MKRVVPLACRGAPVGPDATLVTEAPAAPPVASPALAVSELPELREQLRELREAYGPALRELVGSLVSDRPVDSGQVLAQVLERVQTVVADGSAAPQPSEALVAALPADLRPADLPLAQIRQAVREWAGSGAPGEPVAPGQEAVSWTPQASTPLYSSLPATAVASAEAPVMRCGAPVTRGTRCGGGETIDLNGPITSPTLGGRLEDPRWTPTERNLWKVSRDRILLRQEENMIRLQIEQGGSPDDPLLQQLKRHHQQLQLQLRQLDEDWYKWHNQRSREGGRR